MHANQGGEDAQREEFLVIPMLDERARSVEDRLRRRAAAGIPDPMGLWRNTQLGSERGLREIQRFPTLAEGLWGHGTTTVPSACRTSQGKRPSANFSQLILAANRSFRRRGYRGIGAGIREFLAKLTNSGKKWRARQDSNLRPSA